MLGITAAVLLAALPCSLPGAVRTWDGGGRGATWDDAGNWSGPIPPAPPAPGDDLVFPAGTLRLSNTNDFPAGTDFNRITWPGAGYTAGGNQVALTAGIVASHATGTTVVNLPVSLSAPQTFDVTQAGAALTLNGNVSLGSRGLTIGGAGNTTVAGGMSGFLNLGSVRKTGTGTLTISSAPSYTGNTTVDGGTLSVSGSLPNSTVIVNSGGTLRGTGPVDGITANSGGTVRPGTSVFFASDLVSTDNVALLAGSNLVIGLNGGGHGVGYGGLDVTGTVTLGGTLTVNTAFTPEVGTMFTIISNDGTDEVVGTFAGLPDGAQFIVSGRPFRIYYGRGFGLARLNDVIIEAVPALKIWDGGGGVNNLWTEPLNWDDDVAPLPGDDLQFIKSSTSTTLLTNNDYPAGTVFGALILPRNRLKLEGNTATFDGVVRDYDSGSSPSPGIQVVMPVTLCGGLSLDHETSLAFEGPTGIDANQIFSVNHPKATLRINGPFVLGGHNLTVERAPEGQAAKSSFETLIGPGTLIKTGVGSLQVDNIPADAALHVNGGTVSSSDTDGPVTVNTGGVFHGSFVSGPVMVQPGGTVGSRTIRDMQVNGGTVDLAYSSIEITGTVTLTAGAVVRTHATRQEYEGEYYASLGRLAPINSAVVNLNGATLAFTADALAYSVMAPGDPLYVVGNFNATLNGTFTGLPEGARFIEDGHIFTMTYAPHSAEDPHNDARLLVDMPHVWDGGGSGNLWTTAANWDANIAPLDGMSVTFPAGVSKKGVLGDHPDDFRIRMMNLADSGYICAGNRIRLTGGIVQTAAVGENRIVNNLLLTPGSGGLSLQVDGSGRLILEGGIAGSGAVMKTGAGRLRLAGSESNTGPLSWSITAGELELDKSGALAISGSLTIGNGTDPAVVSLLGNGQIAETSSVAVNANATFDVGTSLDEIGALNGAGKVELGRGFTPGRLTLNSGTFTGFIGGTGFLTKTGTGILTLAGTSAFSGRMIANGGTLSINGGYAGSELLLNGGTLRGIGYAGPITGNTGGVLHPGNSTPGPYVSLKSKDVVLNAATTFIANISGTDPGVETQSLDVTGTVNPGGCVLGVSLLLNPIAATGTSFTIIENDGTDPVQGTFAGLPQGSVFVRDGMRWQISYTGGTGNDVVLTLLELLPPAISSSQLTTNGSLTSVSISGVAPERTICDLESSPNLVTWAVVRTMTATADGTFNFNYTPPASTRRLCFRVRMR